MNEKLTHSTVRIQCGDKVGSGCLLEGGWVLSCYHTIKAGDLIHLTICNARGLFDTPISATLEQWSEEDDLSLFKIDSPLPAHSVSLSLFDEQISQGEACRLYGFSKLGDQNGIPFNSAVLEDSSVRDSNGQSRLMLTQTQGVIEPGFSGSAIVGKSGVVGILLQTTDQNKNIALGIPASQIATVFQLPIRRFQYILHCNKDFLSREKARISHQDWKKQFYLADPQAQWPGVMNDLVAPKTDYSDIKKKVVEGFSCDLPIVGLLSGSGGMGKTTTARNLVAHLHQDYDCFWIDDISGNEESLLEELNLLIQQANGKPTLIVLDDWGKFDENNRKAILQIWKNELNRGHYPNIRYLVTARDKGHSDITQHGQLYASGTHFFYDLSNYLSQDNEALMLKAIRNLGPQYQKLYESLFSPVDNTGKPFHLLFVLLRAAQDSALSNQLIKNTVVSSKKPEERFKEIIQYDLQKLYADSENKCLVQALTFFAYAQSKHNYNYPIDAFLCLADYYYNQPNAARKPGALLKNSDPEDWPVLHYYVHKGKREKKKQPTDPFHLYFKKDEYPEKILQVNLDPTTTVGAFLTRVELKNAVNHLIDHGGNYCASTLPYVFGVKENNSFFSKDEQIELIENLLDRGIGHHTYTFLFLRNPLLKSVDLEQIMKWSKQYTRISPLNGYFHGNFVFFIKNAAPAEWEKYFLELIEEGAISPQLITFFLPEHKRQVIHKLLLNSDISAEMVTACYLQLPEDELIQLSAQRRIENSDTEPIIAAACLQVLKDAPQAPDWAKKWINLHPANERILNIALFILNDDHSILDQAIQILVHNYGAKSALPLLKYLDGKVDQTLIKQWAKTILEINSEANTVIYCLQLVKDEPEYREKILEWIDKISDSGGKVTYLNSVWDKANEDDKKQVLVALLRENKHHNLTLRCLELLYADDIELAKEEALRLLEDPSRKQYQDVVSSCLGILHGTEQGIAIARKLFAEQIISPNPSPNILARSIVILKEDAEVQQQIFTLLSSTLTPQNASIFAVCLGVLIDNPTVAPIAAEILFNPRNNAGFIDVKCRCLQVLKQHQPRQPEIVEYCTGILKQWTTYRNNPLVSNCLNYLEGYPICVRVIEEVFTLPNKYIHTRLYSNILHYGYEKHTNQWKNEVAQVVKVWKKQKRKILGSCLGHCVKSPKIALKTCEEILQQWHAECLYIQEQLANNDAFTNDVYLQKSLAHPDLHDLALQTAQKMYDQEQLERGFLTRRLRETVVEWIENGRRPLWDDEETADKNNQAE